MLKETTLGPAEQATEKATESHSRRIENGPTEASARRWREGTLLATAGCRRRRRRATRSARSRKDGEAQQGRTQPDRGGDRRRAGAGETRRAGVSQGSCASCHPGRSEESVCPTTTGGLGQQVLRSAQHDIRRLVV